MDKLEVDAVDEQFAAALIRFWLTAKYRFPLPRTMAAIDQIAADRQSRAAGGNFSS